MQKSYGYWREDKPKAEGCSHEMISCDFEKFKHVTNKDSLLILPDG